MPDGKYYMYNLTIKWMFIVLTLSLFTGCGGSDPDLTKIIIDEADKPITNDAPVASNGNLSTDEDTKYQGNLIASDKDSASLTYALVTQAIKGRATVSVDGSYTYTPDQDQNGPDSFSFRVYDGFSYSNVANITININPINDAPIANNDSVTNLKMDHSTLVDVLANDTDIDNNTLTIASFGVAKHGYVSIEENKLRYTPSSGFIGMDSFDYTINDGKLSATSRVTIKVIDVLSIFDMTGVYKYTKTLSSTNKILGINYSGNASISCDTKTSLETGLEKIVQHGRELLFYGITIDYSIYNVKSTSSIQKGNIQFDGNITVNSESSTIASSISISVTGLYHQNITTYNTTRIDTTRYYTAPYENKNDWFECLVTWSIKGVREFSYNSDSVRMDDVFTAGLNSLEGADAAIGHELYINRNRHIIDDSGKVVFENFTYENGRWIENITLNLESDIYLGSDGWLESKDVKNIFSNIGQNATLQIININDTNNVVYSNVLFSAKRMDIYDLPMVAFIGFGQPELLRNPYKKMAAGSGLLSLSAIAIQDEYTLSFYNGCGDLLETLNGNCNNISTGEGLYALTLAALLKYNSGVGEDGYKTLENNQFYYFGEDMSGNIIWTEYLNDNDTYHQGTVNYYIFDYNDINTSSLPKALLLDTSTWSIKIIFSKELLMPIVPESMLYVTDDVHIFYAIHNGYVRRGSHIKANTMETGNIMYSYLLDDAAMNDVTANIRPKILPLQANSAPLLEKTLAGNYLIYKINTSGGINYTVTVSPASNTDDTNVYYSESLDEMWSFTTDGSATIDQANPQPTGMDEVFNFVSVLDSILYIAVSASDTQSVADYSISITGLSFVVNQ